MLNVNQQLILILILLVARSYCLHDNIVLFNTQYNKTVNK